MNFIVDEGLPRSFVSVLRQRGHDASHVGELGLMIAPDQMIWRRALADGAVIVTRDSDYAMRHRNAPPHARVLWVRFGNRRKAELVAPFMAALPDAIAQLEGGAKLVEAV